MISREKTLGHLACFVAYAIFGVNIVTCKDLSSSHVISPVALFAIRSFGAASLFWLISLFAPGEKVEKADFPKILAASVLGFFVTQMTFLTAIPDITPVDSSVISSLSPIYTMFIAAVAIKEPLTLKKAGGVVLSFAGIVYLILSSASGQSEVAESTLRGHLLMVANGVSFALYLGLFKPLIQKYSVVTFMKWIFLFALLMSLPLAGKDLAHLDLQSFTPSLAFDLAFLVVGATFVSYYLIPYGQKRIRPTLVSMYSYMQPIVAIAISICVGMDILTWQKMLAVATVFGGVLLVSFSRSGASGR